jgi:signal transduction histidine kinase
MIQIILRNKKRILSFVSWAMILSFAFTYKAPERVSYSLFGVCVVFPLIFIGWNYAGRIRNVSSVAATAYAVSIYSIDQFAIHHNPFSFQYFLIVVVASVATWLFTYLLGRLGDSNKLLMSLLKQKEEAERELANKNAHFEAVVKALPDLFFELDRNGTELSFGGQHSELLYKPLDEQEGRTIAEILPRDAARIIMDALQKAAKTGYHLGGIYSLPLKKGTCYFEPSIAAIGNVDDPNCHFILLAREVTDRITLQQQLTQSQKMEAIGRLAGGIAHDFNNILQIIVGFCQLITEHIEDKDSILSDLSIIKDSAKRAADLTRQLLVFSRKQEITIKPIDLISLLHRMEPILEHSLGEDIRLRLSCSGFSTFVEADEAQLQQVILNLALNARDAMNNGGDFVIETQNITITQNPGPRAIEPPPGDYVRIVISDTGSGMSQETIAHLFEPFYTTKDVGKGTGLGLSIVYSVIKQLHGYIYAQSKTGQGTAFFIYLPKSLEQDQSQRVAYDGRSNAKGSASILVVEDEEAVRKFIQRSLESAGYHVLIANNGFEAIRLLQNSDHSIDLLLTDIVMPGMSGYEVAENFRKARPSSGVILMSGYSEKLSIEDKADNVRFGLYKPFEIGALLQSVQEALEM